MTEHKCSTEYSTEQIRRSSLLSCRQLSQLTSCILEGNVGQKYGRHGYYVWGGGLNKLAALVTN